MTLMIFFFYLSTFTDTYRHGAGSSEPLSVVSNLRYRTHRNVQSANRCNLTTTTYIHNSAIRVHVHEKATPKPEYYNQVQFQELLKTSNIMIIIDLTEQLSLECP